MNQWDAENGLTTSATSNVPRRRLDPWETLAKQRQQEATDRRQRDAILASRASEVVAKTDNLPTSRASEVLPKCENLPTSSEPEETTSPAEEAPEPFDELAWQLNAKITSLMRQRFGINWARHRAHHRLAERALADLKGAGDGKALRNLRNSSGNGSYELALRMKHGPL